MSHKLARYAYNLRHIVALVDDLRHQASRLSATANADTWQELEEAIPALQELSRLQTLLSHKVSDTLCLSSVPDSDC